VIISLAFGSPPLVFAVRCGKGRFGKMPQNFTRAKFQSMHVEEKDNKAVLFGHDRNLSVKSNDHDRAIDCR
jgi:hypothetical protein